MILTSAAQCSTDTPGMLLASLLWIFPLCGGSIVQHWVVTWVACGASKIEIFDSVPAQNPLPRRLWLSYQNSRSPVGRCPNDEYTILLLGLVM